MGHRSNKYYLCYMAVRLLELHRALKETGSLYLHCDPTMSHYLKLLLDVIFGEHNFRNEIVWGYRTQGISQVDWPRKHDVLLLYAKGKETFHVPLKETLYYDKPFRHTQIDEKGRHYVEVFVRDVWDGDVKALISQSKERVGYPTQKPLALLERIINASCPPKGLVLDPFADVRRLVWQPSDSAGSG